MRLPLLALAAALAAPRAGAQPAAPDFAGVVALPYVLCDCDLPRFVFRTTRPLPGYAAPDPAGPVVRTVAAGRLIEGNDWDDALTVVVTPGVAVAARALTLTGLERFGATRYLGAEEGEETALTLAAGDRVEYLLVEEGYAYFRHDGVVYGGAWPFGDDDFRWEREEPEHAVWFHFTPKPGRPAAWVAIETEMWGEGRNVEVVCEPYGGCAPGFRR